MLGWVGGVLEGCKVIEWLGCSVLAWEGPGRSWSHGEVGLGGSWKGVEIMEWLGYEGPGRSQGHGMDGFWGSWKGIKS